MDFLIGILTAKINLSNFKKTLRFISERLNGQRIELSVEANGRKIQVRASSQKELEMLIKKAQEFLMLSENAEEASRNDLLVDLEEKADHYLHLLKTTTKFFENAGLKVEYRDKRSLYVVSAPENLQIRTPATVLICGKTPMKEDVVELVRTSRALEKDKFKESGFFLYGETPDPVVRLRIAEVRLSSNFAVIPIPFAEVENGRIQRLGE